MAAFHLRHCPCARTGMWKTTANLLLAVLLASCANDELRLVQDEWLPPCGHLKLILLTWNLKMLPGPTGEGPRDLERAGRICDAILRLRPDIVFLQEVFDEDVRELLTRRLRGAYPHRVEKCGGGLGQEDSGLYVASRVPILGDATQFRHYHARGPLLSVERIATKGVLGTWIDLGDGRALGAFSTHLFADGDEPGQNAGVRARQLAEAKALITSGIARMKDRGYAVSVLLLGDLNVVGEHVLGGKVVPTEEYRDLLEAFPGAVDLHRVFAAGAPSSTYEPALLGAPSPAGTGSQRIDYVIALSGIDCRGVRLQDAVALSDHCGLIVTLRLTAS